MKHINKFLSVLLAFCLLMSVALFTAACNDSHSDDPICTAHTDANEDGKCDTCGATVEAEVCDDHIDTDGDNLCEICGATVVEPVDYTIILKDENGAGMADVTMTLSKEGETVITGTTDAEGKISGSIVPGEYTINFEGLAQGWYVEGDASAIEIGAEAFSFDFVAIDNNPDGSEDKPYYVGDESVSLTFAPGATYHCFTRGTSSRYLVIENENAKVSYEGNDYLPEDGVIRILVAGAADTNSTMPFTVTNTADGENTIVVVFESLPGTQDNPYTAELDKVLSVNVPKEGAIYYTFTATANGILVITSDTADNNIMMYNTTSYVVTGYTDGRKSVCISVAVGDEVSITIASKASADVNPVDFKLELHSGAADDPVPVYDSGSVRVAAGGTITLVYRGESKTMSVAADGLTLALNGTAQEVTGGSYIITVAEGDVITVTNTADERADVGYTLS